MRHKPTDIECRDTLLALAFLMLLIWYFSQMELFIYAAALILLIGMLKPAVFWPVASVWFALSRLLGAISSKIILTAVFFLLVLPVALVRRQLLGKDVLRLRQWKNGNSSVFVVQDHQYTPDDLKNPF